MRGFLGSGGRVGRGYGFERKVGYFLEFFIVFIFFVEYLRIV